LVEGDMTICAILVGIGLSVLCPEPPPPPPDLAAIELQGMRDEMDRQNKQAERKLDWLYGRAKRPEGTNE
jgi:hypothetical protein